MLIAEEFLLLSVDDVSGKRSLAAVSIDTALGGAVLVELALMERIGVTPASDGWRHRGRVTITSTKPTDDDVLDDSLTFLAEKEGKKATDLISTMAFTSVSRGLRQRLLERLAAAGVLSEERVKILGVLPTRRWPTVDPGPEDEVRSRLRAALVDGTTPTERTVALVGLLQVTRLLHRSVPSPDKSLVTARAKKLMEGDWAAQAVKDAIAEVAAVTAAAAAAGAGASAGA